MSDQKNGWNTDLHPWCVPCSRRCSWQPPGVFDFPCVPSRRCGAAPPASPQWPSGNSPGNSMQQPHVTCVMILQSVIPTQNGTQGCNQLNQNEPERMDMICEILIMPAHGDWHRERKSPRTWTWNRNFSWLNRTFQTLAMISTASSHLVLSNLGPCLKFTDEVAHFQQKKPIALDLQENLEALGILEFHGVPGVQCRAFMSCCFIGLKIFKQRLNTRKKRRWTDLTYCSLFRLCQLTRQVGRAQCFSNCWIYNKRSTHRPPLLSCTSHWLSISNTLYPVYPCLAGPFPKPPSDPNQVSILRRSHGLLVSITEAGEMRLELAQFVCWTCQGSSEPLHWWADARSLQGSLQEVVVPLYSCMMSHGLNPSWNTKHSMPGNWRMEIDMLPGTREANCEQRSELWQINFTNLPWSKQQQTCPRNEFVSKHVKAQLWNSHNVFPTGWGLPTLPACRRPHR